MGVKIAMPLLGDEPTREVALTAASVASNAHYWGGEDQVPRRALTTGMSTLLAARNTLLLVSGAGKREILRRTLEEPVSPAVPGSYLQRASHVTLVADREALPEAPPSATIRHG